MMGRLGWKTAKGEAREAMNVERQKVPKSESCIAQWHDPVLMLEESGKIFSTNTIVYTLIRKKTYKDDDNEEK